MTQAFNLSQLANGVNTSGQLNAATYLYNQVPVANGGTGLSSLTAGYIPYGTGTGAFGSSTNLVWDAANARLGVGTASPTVRFEVNGTAIISGNLGLGVTPSAWGTASGQKAFQIGTSGFALSSSGAGAGDGSLTWNGYYNGTNWIYSYTGGAASRFRLNESGAAWFTAASGTAGNAITFTQAMTLDASGRLGLGETNPACDLDISKASGDVITRYRNGTGTGIVGVRSDNAFTEVRAVSNHGIQFSTNNTERARITSGGDFLVACTGFPSGSSAGFGFNASQYAYFSRSGGEALNLDRFTSTGNTLITRYAGTQVGSISVTASATAYNTSSDYRLKENVQPMTGALAKVAALKPCTYTWKVDGSDGEGFIAHELAEVCPQAVVGEKDAVETYTDEDGNEQTRPAYQGIDTSFLVATLTAAIQEQQAMIDELKAKVAALENA